MKITKVRAVAHEVRNTITGWKISLGSKETHELINNIFGPAIVGADPSALEATIGELKGEKRGRLNQMRGSNLPRQSKTNRADPSSGHRIRRAFPSGRG